MAAETGFLIDGKVYEMPTLDSLTVDEEEVLYERTNLTQFDFVPEVDESDEEYENRTEKLSSHRGFWPAMFHIAYQRGNPDVGATQVKQVIGRTKKLEALSTLGEPEKEPKEVPLASTSEPSESSSSGSLENENSTRESSGSSGSGSTNGSDAQGGDLVSIGTSRSGMSSTSDPTVSAG